MLLSIWGHASGAPTPGRGAQARGTQARDRGSAQDTPTGNTAAGDAGTCSLAGGSASEREGSAVRSSTDGGK
eukprot:1385-Pelagomonas_calceolata.AAC.1